MKLPWSELPDEPNESDTEYDGIFSYAGEVHSGIIGLVAGLSTGLTGSTEPVAFVTGAIFAEQSNSGKSMKAWREVKREPWYAGGMMIVGIILGLIFKFIFNLLF